MKKNSYSTAEHLRLAEKTTEGTTHPWYKWGPYVSERAWGTVREDYSEGGDAWNYFPFDLAASKAFRWGEDGIAGWCDRYQILVLSFAFWNGKDPILKERLFGLSSSEGNHGEDVKECYYYLDGTPTHSYMKYLYKYPHDAFPYEKLKEENRKRTTSDPEFELKDTGIFDDNKYFDIFIEYAKASSEDTCIKMEICNRHHTPAPLHIFPQLLFRNLWDWEEMKLPKPEIVHGHDTQGAICLLADDESLRPLSNLSFLYKLGKRYLYGPPGAEDLFTDNETHHFGHEKKDHYYKDAFHQTVIHGHKATNPKKKGTKACFHYFFPAIEPGKPVVLYLRLTDKALSHPLDDVPEIISLRKKEADSFYNTVHPLDASDEEKMIQRQALSNLCWNKQIYLFDVNIWLKGDKPEQPPPISRFHIRNFHWRHLNSMRILSMPDKWEYPWFAAWDQAFHSVAWGLIDIEFAKEQLWLLLFDQFQHPNGQIPAYEWEFSDLNPPIQAWAALKLCEIEKENTGKVDLVFLEKCFHKLLMNFSWWVNKVDSSGNNVFEGGFLGLDNITVLDRSQKLPSGVKLQQSDGTGWMAFFCLNLMRMAMELSTHNKVYESLATKFFEHYVYIAHAMKKRGDKDYELWSEKDGFFYDVLTYPDGNFAKFRVRSLVGLIPIYAVEYITEEELKKFPEFYTNFQWFLKNRPNLVENCVIPREKDEKKYYVLTPMNKDQLKSLLHYIWNPEEFRSEYGLRSLSKFHEKNPFEFEGRKVSYEPAESLEKIKGGNSNWRGPIWVQMGYLLIESLYKLSLAFQEDIHVKIGQEKPISLKDMADSFSQRTLSLFKKNDKGMRPYMGQHCPFAKDPLWNDHLHFYEYFDPETGKGLGASHQCGWTALVANMIDELRK